MHQPSVIYMHGCIVHRVFFRCKGSFLEGQLRRPAVEADTIDLGPSILWMLPSPILGSDSLWSLTVDSHPERRCVIVCISSIGQTKSGPSLIATSLRGHLACVSAEGWYLNDQQGNLSTLACLD
jgi:hypothetical protein